jgi:hypothetical protein
MRIRSLASIVVGAIGLIGVLATPVLDRLQTKLTNDSYNSGLDVEPLDGQGIVEFRIPEDGFQMLRLKLAGIGVDNKGGLQAILAGHNLDCKVCSDASKVGWWEIAAKPLRTGDLPTRFNWTSNNVLRVIVPRLNHSTLDVESWEVLPKGHRLDSSTYRSQRDLIDYVYYGISLVMLVTGLLTLRNETKKELQSLSVDECVDRLIVQVPSDNPKFVPKIQEFLRTLKSGNRVEDALGNLEAPPTVPTSAGTHAAKQLANMMLKLGNRLSEDGSRLINELDDLSSVTRRAAEELEREEQQDE